MIVVTTPAGQIGSHVVHDLLAVGSSVRVIVRDVSRLASEVRRRVDVVEGSHGDPRVIDRALHGADALFWVAPPDTSRTLEETYLDFTKPAATRFDRCVPAATARARREPILRPGLCRHDARQERGNGQCRAAVRADAHDFPRLVRNDAGAVHFGPDPRNGIVKKNGNTILVTGGTSGIGRALAEAFHARGNRVVIAGRRQAIIDAITAANPGMEGISLDVREPDGVAWLRRELACRFPDLNVVVNNAGISREEAWNTNAPDLQPARDIIATNIVGALDVAAAVLPILLQQPAATIITTTSGLAFVPRANYPTYCASKAFLHSWLQSLRHQLRHTTVEVLELAPPYVQTELAGQQQAIDPAAMPLHDYVAEVLNLLEQSNPPNGEILVERVTMLRQAERNGIYADIYERMNPA